MSQCLQWPDLDEAGVIAVAQRLAALLPADDGTLLIGLEGDLGVGKTVFARALIQALGHRGRVKSPTYGLLESYALPRGEVHHLDLYRIADPGELEYLGLADLRGIILVEWPDRGGDRLPSLDLSVGLDDKDLPPARRRLSLQPASAAGEAVLGVWARTQ